MGNRWKGQTLESRFWSHVSVRGDDECWPWTAHVNRAGYGMTSLAGRNLRASRVSYAFHHNMTVDDIGELHVLHTCDNPICVNPSHLFLGTNADNVADKVAKGRGATEKWRKSLPRGDDHHTRRNPSCVRRGKDHHAFTKPESYKRGECAFSAKLTNEIVVVCRLAHKRYGASISRLAKKFGVSGVAMRNAIIGKTFKNVTEGL